MKIKIYQVNTDRDEKRIAFAGTNELPVSDIGEPEIDSRIYDCVFEGEVDCKSLEDVYRMFNINPPEGYRARSLSVSDVVEVIDTKNANKPEKGFYYCDRFGFYKFDFDPTKAEISDRILVIEPANRITVLFIEPNKYPKFIEIEDTLEAMQKVIGGDIEEYMPFDDEVAIICDEEGKIKGLPMNRAIYGDFSPDRNQPKKEIPEDDKPLSDNASENYKGSDNEKTERKTQKSLLEANEDREILDIIHGSFFLCYAPIESAKFLSLPKDLARKYERIFKYPERFTRTQGGITVVPFKPKSKERER